MKYYNIIMKIKMQEQKQTVSIRVMPSKWRQLKQKCKRKGYKIADVLDYLIEMFLKEKRR